VETGFPSGQTQSVCPEIMLQQRDEITMRFNLIASRSRRYASSVLAEHQHDGAVIAYSPMERHMVNDNAAGDTDRVWDLMKSIGFAMLVTRDGDKLRARPMSAYPERDENAVYFLTDARRHKDEEIARNPGVNLSFADTAKQKYLSVTGSAVISNDRAKIKQLFSMPAKAWWDSADDPNIRVLKVTPDDAEFWDSPGSIASYVKMAAAVATGTRPDIGDNRKVKM
jgi:general stress protein 26